MIDPVSKMNKLEYGTLKKRRDEMKKIMSFDAWLKLLSALLMISLTVYLSVIAYEFYKSKTKVYYELIDLEDDINEDIIFEDMSDQELEAIFKKEDINKTII